MSAEPCLLPLHCSYGFDDGTSPKRTSHYHSFVMAVNLKAIRLTVATSCLLQQVIGPYWKNLSSGQQVIAELAHVP